jgi:hypothetical protein
MSAAASKPASQNHAEATSGARKAMNRQASRGERPTKLREHCAAPTPTLLFFVRTQASKSVATQLRVQTLAR